MPEKRPYSEERLLQELTNGDQQAFDKIYHIYSPAIYRAIMTYTRDSSLSEDILQIVFIKLWEKREDMQRVRSLEDFLFIIARNTILNYWKKSLLESKKLADLKDTLPQTYDHVDDSLTEKEYKRILQEALDNLPSQQYKVYLLVTEEQQSYEEIADRLQLSRLTVKKHLELARRSIRSYMSRHLHLPAILLLILSQSLPHRQELKKISDTITPSAKDSCLYCKEAILNDPTAV